MNQEALTICLQAAVPLHIAQLRSLPDALAVAAAGRFAEQLGSHGDDLMFGGTHCADTFNTLAAALAVLAFQPGGVDFAGLHFQADTS